LNPKDEQTFFDKIKEFANPVEGTAAKDVKDQTDVAYYSYINNLLGGIPEKMAKTVNTDAYNKYQTAKEKYKNIATQGELAAAFTPTAAGNLINAGLIGKVATKAGKIPGILNKIGTGIKAGAILGLEQVAPRLATGQLDMKDSLKNIATSAGLGGTAGAVGGVVSKVGKAIQPKLGVYADELGKMRNQFLEGAAGIDGRATKTILKEYAGQGAKGLGKFAKAEDALNQTARIIDENKLYNIGGDDKYFNTVSQHWKDMNDAAAQKFGKNVPGSALFQAAVERGANDIAEATGKEGEKLTEALNKISTEGGEYEGIHGFKKYLDDAYKDTFSDMIYPKASDKQAARDAVGLIRRNLDDIVADAAEEFGLDPKIIAERKKNYIFDRALGENFAKQIMKPKSIGSGSQTFMRSATKGALGAGLGSQMGEDQSEKNRNMVQGLALGAGSDVLGGLLSKGVNKMATKAVARSGPLINSIQSAVGKGIDPTAVNQAVQAGERFLSGRLSEPKEAAPVEMPHDEYSAPVASDLLTKGETTPEPEKPAVNDKLMKKIDSKLMQIYAANYSDQVSWEDFRAKVGEVTNGFEPVKASKILYQDPKARAKFIRDYKTSQKLKGFTSAYAPESGFLETVENWTSGKKGKSKEQTAYEQKEIVDSIGNLLAKDGALPSDTEIEKIKETLKTINGLNKSPEQKQALLFQNLRDYYGFDLDALQEMGLV